MTQKYLTTAEVAELLRRSEWSVRQLARRKLLPGVRVGGRLLFDADALAAQLQPTVQPTVAAEASASA
jgi:excisionase family DNA binding protein